MTTKKWAMALVLSTTIITASGQLFYKLGARRLDLSSLDAIFSSTITNWPLFLGGFLYFLALVLFIIALKGGELNVLYPLIATGYIWVNILSWHYLDETLNLFKWVGIFFIIAGMAFIGKGAS